MIVTPDPTHPSGINSALEPEEIAAGKTVMFLTGSISGHLFMADGTHYDTTGAVVAVKPEHQRELEIAIHRKHHAEGRFLDVPVPTE